MSDRILDAARRLVLRNGARKVSLSDVAALAGVSRQTIYRYFVSKEELIDALGKHEYRRFNGAMDKAIVGAHRGGAARGGGRCRRDLRRGSATGAAARSRADLRPRADGASPARHHRGAESSSRCVRGRTPSMARWTPADLAGAVARTALSHYMFPDTDRGAARRQLRAAAGLPPLTWSYGKVYRWSASQCRGREPGEGSERSRPGVLAARTR